ncbi:hypothetical protein BBP40_007184 [Aspergillus hancockii]|nr:hypothetical protein BBP40_007184 [Aspergillus hancockii]
MTDTADTKKQVPYEVEKLSDEDLALDDAVLHAQGHRPELARSFSWMGGIGLSFRLEPSVRRPLVLSADPSSIANSWLGYGATFGTPLAYGGGPTTLFGVMIAAVAQWIVLLGLAELCSALPSSGVSLPSIFTRHTTFTLSITGLILVLIALLATGRGNYHPETLTKYDGNSGWGVPPAWLLSITMGQYCYASIGAVTHIAEEMPRPGRRIPLVINLGVLIGVMTAVPWVTVMLCGIQDMDAVRNAFIPSMEIYYQATGSKVGATALQAFMTFLYYISLRTKPMDNFQSNRMGIFQRCTLSNETLIRSREAYREQNGLPFSNYWNHIDPKFNIPVRTTFLSVSFCLLYGLVYIASSTAFNCIVNMSILFLNISFTVPQAILASGRRSKLPARSFDLGRWGYAVNIFSVVWLIFSGILFCFPTRLPTAAGSMNYGSAVLVGVFTIITLLWIGRRKKFSGPKINWEVLNESNKLA